jgi:hypothetical protein
MYAVIKLDLDAYLQQVTRGIGKSPIWYFYDNVVCISSNDTELVIKERVMANNFMP